MRKFEVGAQVEFDGRAKRGGEKPVLKGVVAELRGSGARPRYLVQVAGVTDGPGTWTVPEHMLRPSKVTGDVNPQDLLAAGQDHAARKREIREEVRDARANRLAPRFEQFRVGQLVQYWTQLSGWADTEIVALYPEKGTVKVVSRKALLVEAFGPLPNGRTVKETVTVLVNKVRVK